MKHWLAAGVLIASLATAGVSDDKKGPEIQIIDGKVSMSATAVPLGRLLRLFDMATGLKSKVPPEFANRNVSVRFNSLSFDQAVEKIFEGVPLDYIVVKGQGIMVTSASQRAETGGTTSALNPSPVQSTPIDEQPFFPPGAAPAGMGGVQPPFPGVVGGNVNQQPAIGGAQPAVIQTPFGPMPNPRANQPQQSNTPMAVPGSNLPFGLSNSTNSSNPFGDGSIPTFNPNQTTPIPTTNPFGTPAGTPGAITPFPIQQLPQTQLPPKRPPGQ